MADNFYAEYPVGGGGSSGPVSVIAVTKTYVDFSDPSQSKTLNLADIPDGTFVEYVAINITSAFTGAGITTGLLSMNVPAAGQVATTDPSSVTTSGVIATATQYDLFTGIKTITATLTTVVGNLDGLTTGSADFYLVLNTLV